MEVALHQLEQMEKKWGKKYPVVFKSWRSNWERITQYFKYHEPLRKLIYTTNTVEGYHRMVRKSPNPRGLYFGYGYAEIGVFGNLKLSKTVGKFNL